eukprot:CAMPEP_0113647662 /NCGR_PEP_ID=MMETSP0017_2-20120614/25244_1 /TAXON_ID=2856 /ORGANISM="Cylindrotheca closterium" /LENGTH=110 /DNA_ID=CAMNT_0000559761 /DNA_START=17 /DNA_END=349 /DNA_ORIENTATION=+ /assembly_acc=CAM_ASM_000147
MISKNTRRNKRDSLIGMTISIHRHSGIVDGALEDANACTFNEVTQRSSNKHDDAIQAKKDNILSVLASFYTVESDSDSGSDSEYEFSRISQADLNDMSRETNFDNLLDGL